jgi:hypothetical protein
MNTELQLIPKKFKSAAAPEFGSHIYFLRRYVELLALSLGMLICLYLIWPAFHAVHLEGFTAQTQSLAFIKSLASGVEHDPYLPLVSQFIYQTRSAVIDILAMIYSVAPHAGDMAFRGLVFSSFIVLLVSAMVFAKRWGSVSPVFYFFALIMTPGIPELAFFFNDNIVSAAFACTALTLISGKHRKYEWALSGMLLGLAILSRLDAVFMLPMMIGLVFFVFQDRRDKVLAASIICTGALFVLVVSAIIHGFSLIDAFVTANKFLVTGSDKNNWFWVRIYFFGFGTIPFLLVGAWLCFQRMKLEKELFGVLTFVVYPVLLALFTPKATEMRYIFPLLAPMVALHAGTGLHWVYQKCLSATGKNLRYARGVAIFSVLVAVCPPAFLRIHDGPRVMFGRLWSPILWARWQDSVDETMARTKKLVNELDDQQTNILISTHYNDEFYLRLRLMEAGFLPMRASGNYPGCYGFSLLKKGASTVIHIRTDPQYRIAPIDLAYNAGLQLSAALSCESIRPYHSAYLTTFGENEDGISPKVYAISPLSFNGPLTVKFGDLRVNFQPDNPHLRRSYGMLDFRTLTPKEIMEMQLKAKNYASACPEQDPETEKIIRIEDYEKYYQPSPGPTGKWLMKVREKMGLAAGLADFSGEDHAR